MANPQFKTGRLQIRQNEDYESKLHTRLAFVFLIKIWPVFLIYNALFQKNSLFLRVFSKHWTNKQNPNR